MDQATQDRNEKSFANTLTVALVVVDVVDVIVAVDGATTNSKKCNEAPDSDRARGASPSGDMRFDVDLRDAVGVERSRLVGDGLPCNKRPEVS